MPQRSVAQVLAAAWAERTRPWFSLPSFVREHFDVPFVAAASYSSVPGSRWRPIAGDCGQCSPRLPDAADLRSSLSSHPAAVWYLAGRFRDVNYRDTYITMLGHGGKRCTDLVKSVLDILVRVIETVGHMPNGNRTYNLGHGQPPYFVAMVGLTSRPPTSERRLTPPRR